MDSTNPFLFVGPVSLIVLDNDTLQEPVTLIIKLGRGVAPNLHWHSKVGGL